MADVIRITGLTLHGYHGVYESEKAAGQEFVVDVALDIDASTASHTDSLEHTVNYAEVVKEIAEIVQGQPVDLIETLATTIGHRLVSTFDVPAVTVTVHKPHAPLDHPVLDVSFTTRIMRDGGSHE